MNEKEASAKIESLKKEIKELENIILKEDKSINLVGCTYLNVPTDYYGMGSTPIKIAMVDGDLCIFGQNEYNEIEIHKLDKYNNVYAIRKK